MRWCSRSATSPTGQAPPRRSSTPWRQSMPMSTRSSRTSSTTPPRSRSRCPPRTFLPLAARWSGPRRWSASSRSRRSTTWARSPSSEPACVRTRGSPRACSVRSPTPRSACSSSRPRRSRSPASSRAQTSSEPFALCTMRSGSARSRLLAPAMNSATEAAPSSPKSARKQTRGRSAAMWIVLVIAGLLLLVSAFAVWINRVALNTSVFTDTSTSLLDDDAIRNAIATRAVDELYANVDVQAELQAKLPKDVKSLSGPAAAALKQASYTIVDRALERPEVQKLFKVTLEQTHETLVQVLKGGGNRVSTQNGEVTLDLRTIVLQAADEIGIGADVANKIPPDAGRIVVLRSDQLDTAQNVFELLKTLAWVLPLLTIAAYALAVWLAGERRRAIRGIGITFVVVGVLGLLAAKLTRNYVVD